MLRQMRRQEERQRESNVFRRKDKVTIAVDRLGRERQQADGRGSAPQRKETWSKVAVSTGIFSSLRRLCHTFRQEEKEVAVVEEKEVAVVGLARARQQQRRRRMC